MGFLCGLAAGVVLTVFRDRFAAQRLQLGTGLAALTLIVGAWAFAIM
mgnify:CR=1 FL=1